jgi:phenylpyruvate tautomerase PptA (4-oxalocrotonate tautomerase family)
MMTDTEWKRQRANEGARREKQRLWLCLDPGITTGMALIDSDGELRASTVWGTHEVKESLDTLVRALHLTGYTITVVIEKMPPGSYGQLAAKLERVRRDISMIVEETYELPVVMIAPGEWKPSRVAKTTSVRGWRFDSTPMMTHQKDALRMGRYYLDKVQREAVAAMKKK